MTTMVPDTCTLNTRIAQTRNVFKKDKRRRIKKEENMTQARLSTCT